MRFVFVLLVSSIASIALIASIARAEALASIAPPPKRLVAPLVAHAKAEEFDLARVAQTLAQLDAHVSRAEFQTLDRLYAKRCADAGSVPFFSLSRDDDCSVASKALRALAEENGHPFREVGWD